MQEWLTLKSVVALDSAFCVRSHRRKLMDLLQSDEYFICERFSLLSHSRILKVLDKWGGKLRSVVFSERLTPEQENLVLEHCRNLTHVRFGRNDAYTRELRNVLNSKTTWLDISDTCFSLLQISQCCPNLRTLGLADTSLTDDTLATITGACLQIVHLDIACNTHLSDSSILTTVLNLKSLRGLNIVGCANLTDTSLMHIYTHCAKTLITLQIDCREVTDTHLSGHSPMLSVSSIASLLEKCTQLRTFHLGKQIPDREGDLTIPSSALKNISNLILRGSVCVSDDTGKNQDYCSKMQTLATNLVFNSDPLLDFASKCPNLGEVSLKIGYWEEEYLNLVDKWVSELTHKLKSIKPGLAVNRIQSWSNYVQYDVMHM